LSRTTALPAKRRFGEYQSAHLSISAKGFEPLPFRL
jgi:hypothetical protein